MPENGQKFLNLPVYQEPVQEPVADSEIFAGSLGLVISILFLFSACLLFFAAKSESQNVVAFVGVLSINFTSVVLEALPFMLLGTLLGGLIEVFVPVTTLDRIFGQHPIRGILLAGGLGIFFPTCECAIVPIVRRLILKGVPVPTAICFMLSGPIVNPIVAWSTVVAYNYSWNMVLLRLGCGYLAAVIVALILFRFLDSKSFLVKNLAKSRVHACGCDHDIASLSLPARLFHAVGHAREDFLAVGKYLIIGAFLAALVRTFVPVSSFEGFAATPLVAILSTMVLAIAMNLCSEADAFIAASFRWLLPASAQLAFLVLGPMLDLKLMMMYLSVFRKRAIAYLFVTIFLVVFLLMLAVEFTLPGFII